VFKLTKQTQCGAGVFDCKPLGFIWAKFPNNYTEANTIMFDDLEAKLCHESPEWPGHPSLQACPQKQRH
jgi:hypothetical protein